MGAHFSFSLRLQDSKIATSTGVVETNGFLHFNEMKSSGMNKSLKLMSYKHQIVKSPHVQEPKAKVDLTFDAQKQILKNLKIFVLDNSVRESTVAQLRGHDKRDKYEIWELAKSTGITNCIIATFGTLPSVEEEWLQELKEKGLITNSGCDCYAFTELYDARLPEKVPIPDILPIGMQKIEKYGVPNAIIEFNFRCYRFKSGNWDNNKDCQLLKSRLECLHKWNPVTKVFINYRDSPSVFKLAEERERIIHHTVFLATLDPALRPLGIIFEDATGEIFPRDCGELTTLIRTIMNANGWKDGHLLVHVHKNFGLSEATVLECLSCGATGIWCGISEEGAATGSASSLMTLTNLARLGNEHVISTYNFENLHKAAIRITELSTGDSPHPKQELYGTRALDTLWGSDGMGSSEFDLDAFFGVPRCIRVTTFTTAELFRERLVECFGRTVEEWSIDVAENMRLQLRQDLIDNQKFDYQSHVGLLELYQKAGGIDYINEMIQIANESNSLVPDDHPLILSLHAYFHSYDNLGAGYLTPEQFYHAFMMPYVSCYSCQKFDLMLSVIDLDGNGRIEWYEMSTLGKWAIMENLEKSVYWNVQNLIQVLVEQHIFPSVHDRLKHIKS